MQPTDPHDPTVPTDPTRSSEPTRPMSTPVLRTGGGRFAAHRQSEPGEPLQLPPGARIAWLVVASLFAIATLGFGTISAVSALAHERHTETAVVAAKDVRELVVDSHRGRIEVVGADVDTIRIEARITDGLWDASYHRKRIADRYEIQVRCEQFANIWCGVDLLVVVPRDLEVQVASDVGKVVVRDVTGTVDARSSNGSVSADGLSGSVTLRSDNGRVTATRMRSAAVEATSDSGSVRVEFDADPTAVVAKTDNGSVEVVLPQGDASYAVDINSDNGSETNAVRSDPGSSRSIEAKSDNGSVTVRYAG